jgi:hypothetical protein
LILPSSVVPNGCAFKNMAGKNVKWRGISWLGNKETRFPYQFEFNRMATVCSAITRNGGVDNAASCEYLRVSPPNILTFTRNDMTERFATERPSLRLRGPHEE